MPPKSGATAIASWISARRSRTTTPWIPGCSCAARRCLTGSNAATRDGNCSLSDGMRQLAAERRLRALEIGEAHWQDVDTPEALAHAEAVLMAISPPPNRVAERFARV